MSRWNSLSKMLKWAALFVIVVLPTLAILAEILYRRLEGGDISFAQALLFVAESLTSTGYGELLPFQSWGMILFAVVLMFSGFGVLFIIFTTVATSYIQRTINESAPRRAPRNLTEHVVIISDDQSALPLAKIAKEEGLRFLVLSRRRELVNTLANKGITAVFGDSVDTDALQAANVNTATAVLTLQSDERNVSTVLAVKALSEAVVHATVDDPRFASYIEHAGATLVIPVKRVLGQALARWVDAPISEALSACADDYPGLRFLELPMTPGCPMAGKSLRDLEFRKKTGASVIGMWRSDGYVRAATPDLVLENGSVAIVMADERQKVEVSSIYCGAVKELKRPNPHDLCIVAGAGHVGEEAAKHLKKAGFDVVVVDERSRNIEGLINGDATRAEDLLRAGIEHASALVIAINGDLKCLMTALVARNLNQDLTIVARVNNDEYISRLMMAGADYAVSLSRVASDRLISLVKSNTCPICDVELVSTKLHISSEYSGRTLAELPFIDASECVVAVIEGNGQTILSPGPESIIPAGATITVLGEPTEVTRARVKMGQASANL